MVDNVLARTAARLALQVRRSLSIPRESPLNVFDVAQALGMDVRFVDAPSLEGMYVRDPGPKLFLPSYTHRPRARIAFSCAHELGHSQLGHGTSVDRYLEGEGGREHTAEEDSANIFAATLLMPRPAVMEAFSKRQVVPTAASPAVFLRVAAELGVGLRTLLGHLTWGLEVLPRSRWPDLKALQPKAVRATIVNTDLGRDPLVVDEHWGLMPIDVEVGTVLLVPRTAVPGSAHLRIDAMVNTWAILTAARPGISSLTWGGVQRTVRIARAGYTGPLKHRYLPEDEE